MSKVEGGGGVYGRFCEPVMIETDAQLVLLIVVGGNRGDGFSVATDDPASLRLVPALLREVAGKIERGEH